MIIDTIENLEKYATLNPLFPKVVEFLKSHDLNAMADGKYEIVGNDLFVTITTTKGKTPDEAVLETHNKMIDIQLPLSTAETYGYTHRSLLPDTAYDEEKDISFAPDMMADSYVTCQPGMMIIFFPHDGHAPCISGLPEFKKAIFKVKFEI
jgi:YhcH/YjgK/YiaL family protein